MGARGKKSQAALAVVPDEEDKKQCDSLLRPEAPEELTAEEAEIWIMVVDRCPADWFPAETHPLLIQYCRHIVNARILSNVKEDYLDPSKADKFDLKTYREILKSEEEQSRAISSLATRMRLSQQATYHPEKKKPGPKNGPPWIRKR